MWWQFRPEHDAPPTAAQDAEADGDGRRPILTTSSSTSRTTRPPPRSPRSSATLGIDLVLVSDHADRPTSSSIARTSIRRGATRSSPRCAQRPEVEIAEPDAQYVAVPPRRCRVAVAAPTSARRGPAIPNDPLYPKQWHMRQIGMPEAWKLADGNGVIVAVLDTGVAYEDHKKFQLLPDLKGIDVRQALRLRRQHHPRQRRPRPRLARDRHDRAGHEQRHRRRRRRAQRQDHAAQGARRPAARARSAASPTRSATRPTTAPRSST